MAPSAPAEAIRPPSGLKATLKTQSWWPASDCFRSSVLASQIFTVRSQLDVAIRLPSGL